MIGEIVLVSVPYFDAAQNSRSFKHRPFLVVGEADARDYTVLPVSKVSDANYRDPDYDIPVDPNTYPLLRLKLMSYVRTHKATVAHRAEIGYKLGNMKASYPDLYIKVVAQFEEHCKNTVSNAL
jgi:hypothetical protein